MLNKAPNNNNVTRVANIVLNKAPNSNDATRIANNVHLTTMDAQQFSMAATYIATVQKSRYTRDKR